MAHVHRYPPQAAPAPHPQAWPVPQQVPGAHPLPHAPLPYPPPMHMPYQQPWPGQPPLANRPPQFQPNGLPLPVPIPQQTNLLSQPHLSQLSQPQTQPLPTPTPSTATSSSAAPSASDLEQKRKERDKREKERKEREMRKQRELEQQKRESNKQQQHLAIAKETKQFNLLKSASDFICKMQFRNNLPDIPFDPKLLHLPLDSSRYTKCFSGSSLENNYKHTLFTETDLGIPINLIDTDLYKIPSGTRQPLDPEDQALIDATVTSAPTTPSATPTTSTRNKVPLPYEKPKVRPTVTWLRKTSYLTSEDDLPQFKAKGVEAAPSKYKLQRAGNQAEANTLEAQIKSVEDMFDAVNRDPVHPTNPTLRAVEILPVFPDFTLWPNMYTEVVFDSDPVSTLSQERIEQMTDEDKQYYRNNAIVRGMRGQQLIAFMAPTSGNRKRSRQELTEEGDDEEYEQVNAFHFDVAKDADLKDNYFFVFTPEAVYYNELATRVKLRKVQSKESKALVLEIPKPSSVYVACEPIAENTQSERDERFAELLQPASADDAADL